MKLHLTVSNRFLASLALWAALCGSGQSQVFTIQVGASALPPTPLVSHADDWRYRKGDSEPQADWKTSGDAGLDATWLTGPGGFGYGDGDDATVLNDMLNGYNTVYIRRSFSVDAVDPSRRVILKMDWDDGFVAYLDGVEVARSPNVTVANPVFNSQTVVGQNHEASAGGGPQPTTYDLGTVGSLLAPGTHVLALHGLNSDPASTDFSLIADLSLSDGAQGTVVGPLLAVVNDTSVEISGTNAIPGSARLTVNGLDAVFAPDTGVWSKMQTLSPGYNRLVIEAVDAAGAVLFSTNQVVVSEIATTYVNSVVGDTVFDSSMGVIRVTNSLTVPAGATLRIRPGSVVLLGPAVSLRATVDASLIIEGTREKPACLMTADGLTMWGEIAADGTNSVLTVRHAETIGGAVKGRNGASCLLEDSYFHDYKNGSVPIAGCTRARFMTVRRCHFRVYHETLWQNTLMTVEDCLFELANNPSSDALDFDGAVVGSVIRRCTFRHGPQSNTDAIDLGSATQPMLVEDCLMYGFPNDKGVSIGESTFAIEIRNCLMHGNDSGVAVKDDCTATIHGCTIVNNDYGFRCYNKANPASETGGGLITNSYNNIIWNSRVGSFEILNNGIVTADHSDFDGTAWPGVGNFDADPLFLIPAQRDYRLADNSPCIGAGRDGATLGCKFPVGAAMAPSHSYFSTIALSNGMVNLGFWVDSEKNYTVQGSDTATPGAWTKISDVYHQMVPRYVEVSDSMANNHRFYRLVSPVQP